MILNQAKFGHLSFKGQKKVTWSLQSTPINTDRLTLSKTMYSMYLYSLFIYLDFFPYWCLSDSQGI